MMKIHYFFYNLSPIKYLLLGVILCFVINIASTLIALLLFQRLGWWSVDEIIPISQQSVLMIITAVIISPVAETLLFQVLPINIMLKIKFFCNKMPLIIFISAFIFGFMHGDLRTIIYAFIVGIFLAYTYIIYKLKNSKPILFVALLHSLINLSTVLIAWISVYVEGGCT